MDDNIRPDLIVCAGCKRPFDNDEWREHRRGLSEREHWIERDSEGNRIIAYMGPAMIVRVRDDA